MQQPFRQFPNVDKILHGLPFKRTRTHLTYVPNLPESLTRGKLKNCCTWGTLTASDGVTAMALLGMFGFRGFVMCYFLRDQKGKEYTKKTNIYSGLRKKCQLCLLALYSLPALFWFLFLIYSQSWVQPPRQMFILNIYITCILWRRRGRKLPSKPLQGAAFCLVTFFLSFFPVSCSFVALPEKDLPALRVSCDANSLKYVIICSARKELLYCTWTCSFFHTSCTIPHSLPAERQQAVPQLWSCPDTSPDLGAVAQHWLFSWPDETSKGFQHRRDTSCGLGTQREIFPALAPSAKTKNSQI